MPAPFVPKAPRGRIPVSEADRAAARAGMDGEKTKQASDTVAPAAVPTQPAVPVAIEPTAASTLPTAPVAPELVATAPTTSEPVLAVATAPAPTEPTAIGPAAAPIQSSPQPSATAAPGRRGRKPAVATAAAPVALRSLKVPEASWLEIKLVVAQLAGVPDVPHNIQTYIEAAHQHYEAYLRKQGRLPSK